MHYAARKGHSETLTFLLEKGMKPDLADEQGYTPLLDAALGGNVAEIERLVEAGANIRAVTDSGAGIVMLALQSLKPDVVTLAMDKGAPTDGTDPRGRTALELAVSNGFTDIARRLISDTDDVNKPLNAAGATLFLEAVRSGHLAMVELMLDHGADIKAKDLYGSTALMTAASTGNALVVKYLLKTGADIKPSDNSGASALMRAAIGNHDNIIDILLTAGAEIEHKNNEGMTALIHATQLELLEAVQTLLDNGADINATDNYGKTSRDIAARKGNDALTMILQRK